MSRITTENSNKIKYLPKANSTLIVIIQVEFAVQLFFSSLKKNFSSSYGASFPGSDKILFH
jgi:hypothetical protein